MNNNEPIWRFPTTFDGGGLGFNDGGTQLFKDDSVQSLAREVCQNSIDARPKDSNVPAEVEFRTFKINCKEFPGYDDFSKIIHKEVKHCQYFYKNNKAALEYYQEAEKTLNQNEILCLRISDFNTTGLTFSGSSRNNNWANLVIHSGTNDKNPEDGGSFGLGKNAMYACSKFGSLMFSTHTIENIKKSECVAKLSYYYDEDGSVIHGLGNYGLYSDNRSVEDDRPITGLCNLDKNFTRRENEYGTDVYVLGFELSSCDIYSTEEQDLSKFEYDISSAIIDNYFVSILEKKLIVKINDITINSDNLYEIFDNIYEKHPELFNSNTVDYLEIMKGETEIFPISIMEPDLPDAELRINLNPNYHNRIAMVRNTGMKIFDKGNFPQITIFSGILVLRDKTVNGYFKKMENPAHDDWILDRIKADKVAKQRYDRMLNQIRNIIKQLAKENAPESMDVAGLGEMLPDDIDDGIEDNKQENIVDDIVEEIEVKERKQLPVERDLSAEDGEVDSLVTSGTSDDTGEFEAYYGNTNSNNVDGGNVSTNTSSGNGGNLAINKGSTLKQVKKRNFYNSSKQCYMLIINSTEDINNCKIAVFLSGEQANFPAIVGSAYIYRGLLGKKNLAYKDNIIQLGKIQKGEKIELSYTLKDAANYSIEVNVYED